jgi:hypothetical protein
VLPLSTPVAVEAAEAAITAAAAMVVTAVMAAAALGFGGAAAEAVAVEAIGAGYPPTVGPGAIEIARGWPR